MTEIGMGALITSVSLFALAVEQMPWSATAGVMTAAICGSLFVAHGVWTQREDWLENHDDISPDQTDNNIRPHTSNDQKDGGSKNHVWQNFELN